MKLDMRYKVCPYPVIETKKALKALKEDDTIEVLVDNEIATENLEKMAKQLGYHSNFKIEKLSSNEFRVIINKGKGNLLEADKEIVTKSNSSSIIVISTETMGNGDEELGKKLLEGFIYSLTEQEENLLPKYIIFYNKGVILTTTNKKTVEDLKILSDKGVFILSCGLCLDYYNVVDRLEVGTVTNMYNISNLLLTYNVININ